MASSENASAPASSELVSDSTDEDGEDADISDSSSFMAHFKQPNPSVLARKRKIQTNPPVGKKRSRGKTNSDPKKVSPADRIKLFPDEHFSVSVGKLFCLACREVLSTKKSVLGLHIKSVKYKGERGTKLQAKEGPDYCRSFKEV